MNRKQIILKKVRVHNLKEVDLALNRNQLIVFTGVSGSGKSSLAFDTIYTEGQRRYIESLSTYARRHLGEMQKPDADLIEGISPTIAIEQKSGGHNPRSTVGTLTGIYDYLRVFYARVATPHCPISKEPLSPQSTAQILQAIQRITPSSKLLLLSPLAKGKKGEFKEEFAELLRRGFTRVRLDGKLIDLTDEIAVDGKLAHDLDLVIDRLVAGKDLLPRFAESVTRALEEGKGMMTLLNLETQEETLYSQHAFSSLSKTSYPPLEPQDFSFNHPSGMCPMCQGMGKIEQFDLDTIIHPNLSIAEDCCSVASSYRTVLYGNIYDNLARLYNFSVHTPWKKLSEKAKNVFLYGTGPQLLRMQFIHPTKNYRWNDAMAWKGVLAEARDRYQMAKSPSYRAKMQKLLSEGICCSCNGSRIKPYPAEALLGGKKISEITSLSVDACAAFFEALFLSPQELIIAEELLKEIIQRLHFLKGVGLHYLTLDRTAPTLSGGETQRVRLASQIGSGLVGATYILDEPSIGLHPRDNQKLLATLKSLRDKGNTVIVVEHDEETIREADEIVDVGPLAGKKGGRILYQGNLLGLLSCEESLTGAYLSGRQSISSPKKRRIDSSYCLSIEKASHHNLKNLSVKVPLGLLVAVTGVSGSGKSSLITDTLYPALSNALEKTHHPVGKHKALKGLEHIDKVIAIDQTPIGRTPRSNPATYIKLFDEIRSLYSQLPQSQAQGYKAGRFSFNVKEGSCDVCSGMGMIKIDMDFMEDEWVLCSSCKGARFDATTLSILYRGKNIHEILEMTVMEAREFFDSVPRIKDKLDALLLVGLDYISLGQPSPTLSGGEAQRIKLAKELFRPSTGKTLYLLDEPTTGLHFHDLGKLCSVLHALVDKGNTVLVIEHQMDLVKTADWVIDLGPEGGEGGGTLLAVGTPEKLSELQTPTGVALKEAFAPKTSHPLQKSIPSFLEETGSILVEGATQNNLKNVFAQIPRGKITVCTGPSGSGKTSFAFETLFAEGQRRYIESLSPYARQFLKQMPKPKVERIEGLSAAIAIEQKSHAGNPRSTIGTMTECYDFLRVLFAHLGTAHCPETGEEIRSIRKEDVLKKLLSLPKNTPVHILSPLSSKKESFEELKQRLQKEGYLRIRLNGQYYELDQEIPFERQRKNLLFLVIDRLVIKEGVEERLFQAIDQAATLSSGILVADTKKEEIYFNLAFSVPSTGRSYPPITPHTFSFNTETGMCKECLGLGFQYGADLLQHEEILKLTPVSLMESLWKEKASQQAWDLYLSFLKEEGISSHTSLGKLPTDKLSLLMHGNKEGKKGFLWAGINAAFAKAAKSSKEGREALLPFLSISTCISCEGTRLNPLARNVRIRSLSIADLCRLSIEEASTFIQSLETKGNYPFFLEQTLSQLRQRLHFLKAIGLSYLSLDRSAPTLSGGETQRIRLSRQLGAGLTGCLYVLDEPTLGLHPHDNAKLNLCLRELCERENTLLLVEHDPMTIQIADYLLDFGPLAGKQGGHILAHGSLEEIKKNPSSLTGAYLSGKKNIPLPKQRRSFSKEILIENASLHNLKQIKASLPIQTFTCLTGVSGSGKSTLMHDLLKPALQQALLSRKDRVQIAGATLSGLSQFDKMLVLDQNPIGHTARADVSTYVDLLTPLRTFFASLPSAQTRGLLPRHFSFNHRKGMCPSCLGLGAHTVSMQFLPPVKVPCEECHGFRFHPLTLQITTKGKHLGEVLNMTVQEAKEWLIPIPKVHRILDTLLAVGLGYLKLGQEIASLSGGEAQRIRLSRELAKRATGKTLYLLDEPTVGLHSEDIAKLLPVFHALVDKGNTLVVIEHNLDVIASADWILDLGPGAGMNGGMLIASGTPEEVAKHPDSHTARYLKEHLSIKQSSLTHSPKKNCKRSN